MDNLTWLSTVFQDNFAGRPRCSLVRLMVLVEIGRRPGSRLTVIELAKLLGIGEQQTYLHVRAVVNEGYLYRMRLTEAGCKLLGLQESDYKPGPHAPLRLARGQRKATDWY